MDCTQEGMFIPWINSEAKTELALAGIHAAEVPTMDQRITECGRGRRRTST